MICVREKGELRRHGACINGANKENGCLWGGRENKTGYYINLMFPEIIYMNLINNETST